MIFKILTFDKTGEVSNRIENIFTKFMKGYLVYRAATAAETVEIGKREEVDVIIINGDDNPDLSPEILLDLKRKIVPSPKLLLLLESNNIHTKPALESEAHATLNSSNFRMVQIRNAVHDLIRARFLEDYERRKAEEKAKRTETEELLQDIREIKEELKNKQWEDN
ncbi:MAG TPA: hypothetical protein PKV84_00325 [Candidatus Omnitrophota bacterium]|nr:hypothetical protein [Candidatus Omnitrophota bacterium]